MDLCTLLDDPFHVICHYLANQVFTFDAEHVGALKAGHMLDSTDLKVIAALPRDRKAMRREIYANDYWMMDPSTFVTRPGRVLHQFELIASFRAALTAIVLLARTSRALMHRIPWRGIYFELAPLVSAHVIRQGSELGIPTYHAIADDAFISPAYFYLSILRTIGGSRTRRIDAPQCITTNTRDAMTREMQKLIAKARKADAAAREPRRSGRKRAASRTLADAADEPAQKRIKY